MNIVRELLADCGGDSMGHHRAARQQLASVELNAPAMLTSIGLATLRTDVCEIYLLPCARRVGRRWASPLCLPRNFADMRKGRQVGRPAPTTELKGTRTNAPRWSFNGGPDRASDAAFGGALHRSPATVPAWLGKTAA